MSRDWQESEHPRDPRTGEFTDKPGGWLAQAAGGLLAGFMTHDQIAPYRERDDYEVFNLGPTAVAGSSLIHGREYSDGTRLVVKQHDYDESAYNEYTASRIGWAVGAPVPAVVGDLEYPDITWSQYVVGDVAGTRLGHLAAAEDYAEAQSKMAMSIQGGFELGLFDYLIHNTDRHSGNWIITPPVRDGPKVVGIDHGHIDVMGRTGDSLSSPFSEWILGDQGQINDLTGKISGAELDAIARRIEDLEALGDISRPEMVRLLRKIRDLKGHTNR